MNLIPVTNSPEQLRPGTHIQFAGRSRLTDTLMPFTGRVIQLNGIDSLNVRLDPEVAEHWCVQRANHSANINILSRSLYIISMPVQKHTIRELIQP